MKSLKPVETKFKIKDLVFALTVYMLLFFEVIFLENVFYTDTRIDLFGISISMNLIHILISIVFIGIVFLYIKIRKFRISTFGFSFRNIKKAIVVGFVVSVIIIALQVIRNIIFYGNLTFVSRPLSDYLYYFLYLLFVIAFVEEIMFRGFISTIFDHVIKVKWVSVPMVGILFALIHSVSLPNTDYSFLEIIIYNFPELLSLFSLHCLFWIMKNKTNNLVTPIMGHFTWNYMTYILS